ncbi:MAG: hypothetical protein ACR2RF_08100 [Geminicoccaceae bacterium]
MFEFLIRKKKVTDSTLLDYYVMSMSSLWDTVHKDVEDTEQEKAIAKIEAYLSNPIHDWVEAYRTEQLIVQFMSEVQLDMRYEARLSEAKHRLSLFNTSVHEKNWNIAKDSDKTTESLRAKRAAFQAFLDEIQWEYIGRRLNKKFQHDVAKRLWIFGLFTISIVIIPWITLISASVLGNSFPLLKNLIDITASRAPAFGFYTAISFGLLGAFFSRLNSFQSQAATLSYAQLTEIFHASFLVVRLGFGMVGSMILYFMLAGGFLEGGLFPKFEDMQITGHAVSLWDIQLDALLPNPEFAKLIVWSFIGGFSERLIPAALEKTESQAQEN